MTLMEKLEAAKATLAEVKTDVEAGEKSADDLSEAIEAVKTAQAQVDAADEAEKLMKSLETPTAEKADKEEEKAMPKNLGENFVEMIKGQEVGKRFNVLAPAFKANNTVQSSLTGNGVDFATTYDRNVVEAARTPLVIRDLFAAESISGSTLMYLVEGAIEGAPAATLEGAAKPQVHFADPTPKTVSLSKIACHIKESDEYINDYAFLASSINGRLLYELGLVEQNTLVATLVANTDIQTDATSWTGTSTETEIADLILKAAMDVQEQSGFAADGIVLNPAVWYKLRIGKNNNGYYGGGYFGGQDIPNLWGIPVCVTTAVTADQIIVGAFKTCGSVVTNGGVSVEATNTDQDDFIKNLMTIRAEERLALAIRRPKGFKLLSK